MKSSRRHELKQNVLDEELLKVGRFFRKYGNYIFWGVLVVAVAAFVIWRLHSSRRSRAVELQSRYENLVAAQNILYEKRVSGLESLAEQDDNPRIAALSMVALGDVLLQRALRGKGDPDELFERAREYYKRVVENFAAHRGALAKARLGLAKLAENQYDIAEAKKHYQAVLDMDDLAGWPAPEIAKDAMEKLDQLQRPVRMAGTAPAPETQPATAPRRTPGTLPATLPHGDRGEAPETLPDIPRLE